MIRAAAVERNEPGAAHEGHIRQVDEQVPGTRCVDLAYPVDHLEVVGVVEVAVDLDDGDRHPALFLFDCAVAWSYLFWRCRVDGIRLTRVSSLLHPSVTPVPYLVRQLAREVDAHAAQGTELERTGQVRRRHSAVGSNGGA